jgi:hypothetical protein
MIFVNLKGYINGVNMQNLFGLCYEQFNFANINPFNDMKRRGMLSLKDETQALDGYEYGHDALRLWNFLQKFYTSIIETEYNEGNLVKNDATLQSWVEYIKDVGLMRTFPEICTNLDLTNIVTSIVFQLSVQHSAINYTQAYYYGFTRNAPACIFNLDKLTDWQSQINDKLFDIIPKKTLLERRIHELLSLPPSKQDSLLGIIDSNKTSFYQSAKFDSPRNLLLKELQEFEQNILTRKSTYKVFNPKETLAGGIFA